MKKALKAVIFFFFTAFMMSGCANGPQTEATKEYPGIVKGKAAVMTAIVVAVDMKKRIITLENQEGELLDFRVGEEAANLPQVSAGDRVMIKFFESVAVEVVKPGTATAAGETTTIVRAKPGEMPGGMITHQTAIMAFVKAINKQAGTISLMGRAGKTVKIKIEDPANLEKVKVGDELMITFTEARATSIEHVK